MLVCDKKDVFGDSPNDDVSARRLDAAQVLVFLYFLYVAPALNTTRLLNAVCFFNHTNIQRV
jgi:hypothetical protein